jgi:hypothetical protein
MYGVFGVSMALARQLAEKKTSAFDGGRALNVQEYRAKVSANALRKFRAMPIRLLSPVYSNYADAQQYRDICQKSDGYAKLVIRRRLQLLDGEGKPRLTKKTKKPILTWEDAHGQEIQEP